jgi:short-subunit dehydrogenase
MSYAIITGASGGIGKEIALELATKGYDLFLVARNQDALSKLAEEAKNKSGRECRIFATDLSRPGAAKQVYDAFAAVSGELSILVNNAGYGLLGNFDVLTFDEQLNMMQLNMLTLSQMCYVFLPLLKKQQKSYILNIASTAAYQAVPSMSVYAATKSFVLSFSRGLHYELRQSPVSVTVISPGPVSTGFMDRAGMKEPWLVKRSEKFAMQPGQVAKLAVSAMFAGKKEVVPGFLNALAATLTSFAPKSLAEKIAAGLYEK